MNEESKLRNASIGLVHVRHSIQEAMVTLHQVRTVNVLVQFREFIGGGQVIFPGVPKSITGLFCGWQEFGETQSEYVTICPTIKLVCGRRILATQSTNQVQKNQDLLRVSMTSLTPLLALVASNPCNLSSHITHYTIRMTRQHVIQFVTVSEQMTRQRVIPHQNQFYIIYIRVM